MIRVRRVSSRASPTCPADRGNLSDSWLIGDQNESAVSLGGQTSDLGEPPRDHALVFGRERAFLVEVGWVLDECWNVPGTGDARDGETGIRFRQGRAPHVDTALDRHPPIGTTALAVPRRAV